MITIKAELFFDIYGGSYFIGNFDKVKFALGLFMFFSTLLYVTHRIRNNHSTDVIYLLSLLFILPSFIQYCYNGSILSLLIYFLILLSYVSFKQTLHLQSNSQKIISIFGVTISAILLIPMISLINFSPGMFFLDNIAIYEARENASVQDFSILSYLHGGFFNFILPYIIIRHGNKKNYLIVLIATTELIAYFMIFGLKSTLFIILLLITSLLIRERKWFYRIGCSLLIVITSIVTFNLNGINLIFGGLIHRLIILPGVIAEKYIIEFYNQPIYFSQTFLLNKFSLHSYSDFLSPQFLIGSKYFNNYEMRANSGIISDGIMNLGLIGGLLYAVIFFYIIRYFSLISHSKGIYPLIIASFITVQNSFLLTFLGSNGFIIFTLYIFISNQKFNGFNYRLRSR